MRYAAPSMRTSFAPLSLAALFFAAPTFLACTNLLGNFTEGAGGATVTSTSAMTGTGGAGGAGGSTATGAGSCGECSTNATCMNLTCSCKLGYEGDGKTCNDVDECTAISGFCGPDTTCSNTDGGADCTCLPGFTDSPSGCTAIWKLEKTLSQTFIAGYPPHAGIGNGRIFFANDDSTNPFFNSYSYALPSPVFNKEGPMPTSSNDFCACGFGATFSVVGDTPFVFGNYGQAYLGENQWQPVPTYVAAVRRGEASSAVVGSVIYLLGGRNGSNMDQSTMFTYDAKSNQFGSPGDLPVYPWGPVSRAGMTATADALYVAGGTTKGSQQRAAKFDLATKTWSMLPDMPFYGFRADLVPSPDGVLVGDGQSKKLARYLISTGEWSKATFTFPPDGDNWRLVGTSKATYAIGNVVGGLAVFRLANLP